MAHKPASSTDFWTEVSGLMKQIEQRAYQFFEGRGCTNGHDLEDWFKAEQELFKCSALDIREKDSALHVRAELPGFQPEELEINLEPRNLTIKGSRKKESEKKDERTYYSEKQATQVFRKLSLPGDRSAGESQSHVERWRTRDNGAQG